MDRYLLGWARRVKARHGRDGRRVPPLWLFTDALRLPDPLAVIERLPPRLCGVVLRHDDAPGRLALGRAIARACRARAILLSVAGDWRLAAALRAGLHLRGGRAAATAPRWLPRLTASAHSMAEAGGRAGGVHLAGVRDAQPRGREAARRAALAAAGSGGRTGFGRAGWHRRRAGAAASVALPGGGRDRGVCYGVARPARPKSWHRPPRCRPATVFRNCHVEAVSVVAAM
jgi:thiamine-phosphate pyrophosphorylase